MRVRARDVESIEPNLRELYEDFCVLEGEEWICPRNFNDMPVSWYLNHSEHPNAKCGDDLRFVALRVIRVGEEITADYREYSDDPLPWLNRKSE